MNSNSNYLFRNRVDIPLLVSFLYESLSGTLLYLVFFWGDWYGMAFFFSFCVLQQTLVTYDRIRNRYRVQNDYLYITEYSWIFRKKEIEIPIRHITDVILKKSLVPLFVYPRERVRIVVGKAKYDLKAVSCRVELYNCLTKMVKNNGNSNNC